MFLVFVGALQIMSLGTVALHSADVFENAIGFQLDERALTEVMKKLFKSYKKWCKYLDRRSSLW